MNPFGFFPHDAYEEEHASTSIPLSLPSATSLCGRLYDIVYETPCGAQLCLRLLFQTPNFIPNSYAVVYWPVVNNIPPSCGGWNGIPTCPPTKPSPIPGAAYISPSSFTFIDFDNGDKMRIHFDDVYCTTGTVDVFSTASGCSGLQGSYRIQLAPPIPPPSYGSFLPPPPSGPFLISNFA